MNNSHTHSPTCLARNELNETCCVDHQNYRNAMRITVELRSTINESTIIVHTFTDNDDDAIALARAENPNLETTHTHHITFRDTNHELDEHAHYGFCIDVDNPQ